jgi:hypothetical protein
MMRGEGWSVNYNGSMLKDDGGRINIAENVRGQKLGVKKQMPNKFLKFNRSIKKNALLEKKEYFT